ncbi:iron chelate uptake ABC transporter family permease subunit [Xinfangfangia sp. CPCC 101601]|uniref:Iron chelate uptake ABC transporter family permease subunit n=1 Tax=Pseudogemmobacter lacusdianii TaxID=3069608 RepID=A0ABU0W1H1_9RHOB|nr:iron chelate uptake ABC transporter family permease subunit [Xinfangfangia sp. CPCC 101601]MDQ2067869.1 iron chelate uptake ABC transporter family permease subunit [Xinfangfangia sp. CPCC 101601]
MPHEANLRLPGRRVGEQRFVTPGRPALVLGLLGMIALVSICCFMTLGVKGNWGFVLPYRGQKLAGLLLVACAVALSTVLFQTVTNNRILTPSIMGFDALYVLVQTGIMFFLGTGVFALMDPFLRFGMEVVLMIGFSGLLFRWLFLGEERSLHLVVLIGIICGVFFRSVSNFMQRMLDPNAFQVLQDSFFASFSTIDPMLLKLSWVVVLAIVLLLWRMGHVFDVLNLGRATAINLGVNYRRVVITILLIISVLVAISTALVGPITFFGLLVASLAHGLIGNSRHRYILPAAVLLAVICLVGGQTLLERVFAFDTALSIIIEFLGGIVFIVLVIRGAAR